METEYSLKIDIIYGEEEIHAFLRSPEGRLIQGGRSRDRGQPAAKREEKPSEIHALPSVVRLYRPDASMGKSDGNPSNQDSHGNAG